MHENGSATEIDNISAFAHLKCAFAVNLRWQSLSLYRYLDITDPNGSFRK